MADVSDWVKNDGSATSLPGGILNLSMCPQGSGETFSSISNGIQASLLTGRSNPSNHAKRQEQKS